MYNQCSSLLLLMVWLCIYNKRQYTEKNTNIEKFYVYASELRKFSHFYILKLLFLSIFFVGTSDTLSVQMTCLSAYMYRQISKCTHKTLKKPNPPLATLMAGDAKEADIWFGESAREARGKFKDLVCLVLFLCWIKRLVLLPLCLNANIWIDIFQAFKNRGGDDPPQKNSRGGGDTSPPSPPPPRDRRLCYYGQCCESVYDPHVLSWSHNGPK